MTFWVGMQFVDTQVLGCGRRIWNLIIIWILFVY